MSLCSLCGNDILSSPVREVQNQFCCSGCHAVFNILSTQHQLDNYREHPIFQQALKIGLISNPTLLEQIRKNRPEIHENEARQLHLEVLNMWCPACCELIKLLMLQEKGVLNCVVDYATDLASIEFVPRYISKEKILSLIQSFGYQPSLIGSGTSVARRSLNIRFIVAAFCALNVMMFSYPIYAAYFQYDQEHYALLFAWLSLWTTLPVVTYCAWPIFRRFFSGLRVGFLGMETLVVIGVTTSFCLSIYHLFLGSSLVYFDSLTVIICFVLLGKLIETKAKFSAKDALIRLVRAIPRRGRKQLPDGSLVFTPVKEIVIGDFVHVFQGEKIVLDGVVVSGTGSCDESLMTGESMPVPKAAGAMLLGGAIVQNGSFVFRVTSSAEESALHKIVNTIQQEIGHKSTYIRQGDLIVKWFVPFVVGLSVLCSVGGFLFGAFDLEAAVIRAVSILLISCPCAIGIAAPLAESHVINGLANLGAIVRNRGCLMHLGEETVFVFDKTGTVTEGHFQVLSGLETLDSEKRSILKAMTSRSNHLISVAIYESLDCPLASLEGTEEIAGQGIVGKYRGQNYYLGSAYFLQHHADIDVSQQDGEEIHKDQVIRSQVYFAQKGNCICVISLGDQLRVGIADLIKGIAPVKTILLSGDAQEPVATVAAQCGFDEWYAQYTPLQKKGLIDALRLKGAVVCMVGDGINDALALTSAHVGISVVSATEISIQVSDLLLTTDRLQVLLKIRKLARKGHQIVKQNMFWAFFYNVVGIVLAVAGYLSPIFAAFAMVASSLMVLFNAKRVR